MGDVRIRDGVFPDDLAIVRRLFEEYVAWLGRDLSFQGFAGELADLPGAYAPPQGRLLLALSEGDAIGCVAMRPRDTGVCEMKRLFVRPHWRSCGAGAALVDAILEAARTAGYQRMVLDTLAFMRGANALYEKRGFSEIPPYYHNPLDGVRFMARDL